MLARHIIRHLSTSVAAAFAVGNLLAQTPSAPVIATQPRSQTISVGATVTFTVVASGSPLAYQWQFDGSDISGATSASLTISNVLASYAGAYTVTVGNSGGSTASAVANLVVYTPYAVQTVSGTPLSTGNANGTGAAARFFNPQGIAVDGAGNIYVADTGNGTIRRVAPGGAVTTLAGTPGVIGVSDGIGPAAQFYAPTGVAVDGAGNVYVADTFNSTIRKITPAGVVTTLAGLAPTPASPDPLNRGSADGNGSAARFNCPRGVAVDGAGNVYVADTLNNTIRKISPAGAVTTLAGAAGQNGQALDGAGSAARFDYPFGIASDRAGNLWVADTSGQLVRAVSPAGNVTTLAGLAGNSGSSGGAGGFARFSSPAGIAVDGASNVYIADSATSILRELLPNGAVVTLAGAAGAVGSADGTGSAARFYGPYALACDSAGNLIVADTFNATVRRAVPTVVAALASSAGRLANLSARAAVTAGAGTVAGFSSSGSASKNILLRAVGPGLAPYGVSGYLPAPLLTLFDSGGSIIGSNSGWGGGPALTQLFSQLGAFALPAGSADAALVETLPSGAYSCQVSGAGGTTGVTLAEIYDADGGASPARLVNLSARATVGTGGSVLVAGFAVAGPGWETLLLRGAGPSLASYGITGALAHPQLVVQDAAGRTIATNSGWGGYPALSAIGAKVYAFPLLSPNDAAIVVTLPPGTYTATLSSADGATGIGLAEVYEVP